MITDFLQSDNASDLEHCLLNHDTNEKINTILVHSCANNGYTPALLDSFLQKMETKVFGGIFPGIIYEDRNYDIGNIVIAFEESFCVKIVENLSDLSFDTKDSLCSGFSSIDYIETMFVFVDGFAKRINTLIEEIFTNFGLNQNYLGGGCGSLLNQGEACVITNQGILSDCAVIAGCGLTSGVGVKHGWESISSLYQVTASDGNVIQELDFKPAFDIYRPLVEGHSGMVFNESNFFEIAKSYPLGISKIDAENIVRDPIAVGNNGDLICVGEVATGAFVSLLTANRKFLISAAGQAIKTAKENNQKPTERFVFFIDCISRSLFLEEEYSKELQEVGRFCENIPVCGVLSIGEIANNGKDYLEFYNKTAVIGCF